MRDRESTASAAALVLPELEAVERRLAEALTSREPRISEISQYLVYAGGKRVRPTMTLLSFRSCGGRDAADAVDVAVALELIHSASLLHDDIIDDSDLRRGRDSARRKFGTAETLVTGDFLFSRAFQICGRFDEQLIRWASDACIALTEGEVMQSRFRRNPAVTLDDYVEIVHRKTASLFEQASRIAADLAQPGGPLVEPMARCGRHVGITFQMVDDLLDVTAPEEQLGKPNGLDVREGNPSLPIVLAIADDPELAGLFAAPELDDADVERALERLRSSAALREGYRLAREHATCARDALHELPPSPYRDTLENLIGQLVDRIA